MSVAPAQTSLSIRASVGKYAGGTRQCYNVVDDQLTVIKLLNRISNDDGGAAGSLREDRSLLREGIVPDPVFLAILTFQQEQLGLSVDGHVDPGEKTIARLNELAFPFAPVLDPRTDPGETLRIQKLLEQHRPFVPVMINAVLDALPKCQQAFEAFFEDPLKAAVLELQNQFAIDGLFRLFHVDRLNHKFFVPTIAANFQVLLSKVPRLPLDQAPIDFPTLIIKFPDEAVGTTMKKDAGLTVRSEGKMFFTPVYRPVNTSLSEPFTGFLPEGLRGIQVHEMGHFFLGFDEDRNPRNASAQQCLTNSVSYDLLARQIAFRTRVRLP